MDNLTWKQLNEDWYQTSSIVGCFYIAFGILGIFGNCTVAYLMSTDRETRSNATYVFMINLAIADALVLSAIALYAGVHCLIPFTCDTTDRIFAWMVAIGWYPGCIFFMCIAFTRWVAMTKSEMLKVYFKRRNLIVLTGGTWLLCSLFYSSFLFYSPNLFVWFPMYLSWGFDEKSSVFGFYLQTQNTTTNIIFASVEVYFNVRTTIWLRKTRKEIRTVQQSKNRKREMKLFVQCFLTGTVFMCAAFFYALFYAVSQWAQPGHFVMMHMAWIMHHVINPIIYFCINNKLRQMFFKKLWRRNTTTTVTDISQSRGVSMKTVDKY